MPKDGRKFGEFIRHERMAKEIGLREMAKKIGVSPSYLSKIERDEFPPPSEDKVMTIARLIGRDSDEVMALANRVPSEVMGILRERPIEMGRLLRSASKNPPQVINQLVDKLDEEDGG